LAFTLALIALNALYFHHTKLGTGVERLTYDLLQGRLTSSFRARDLPVVVVDIGNLTRVDVGDLGPAVTPRAALIDIVTALAQQNPKAIGIDIDFSPVDGAYVENDKIFFGVCDAIRAGSAAQPGVPIFLGIGRTQSQDPALWLPDAPKSLAASITKPPDILSTPVEYSPVSAG
jgi:hypothetical protein